VHAQVRACPADGVDDWRDACARGAFIEMPLQQQSEQLAAFSLDHGLQLAVSQLLGLFCAKLREQLIELLLCRQVC